MFVPAVAIPAPTIPERMAWLEDVGRPRYHVIKSHAMAAIRAEITVTCVIHEVSISPAPTVLATAVPDNAPDMFNIAAINMAILGVKTLVETDVAIAFAVSWKPFIKSKITASTITQINKKNVSCIFEDNNF